MINTIIIAAVALIILDFLFIYNSLFTAKNRIAEELAEIDVQLQRGTDLIPNLVETVTGYSKPERKPL